MPWSAWVRLNLLDFERHTLRDANAHSCTQDAVSGDLPLSSVLHYCPEEACPVGAEHGCWQFPSCPPARSCELPANRAASLDPLPNPQHARKQLHDAPVVTADLGDPRVSSGRASQLAEPPTQQEATRASHVRMTCRC